MIYVVIPVYKAQATLQKCLDSLANQTYTDFRAFCVDDGSPDSSVDILKDNAERDSRFYVISTENGGAARARNKALREIAELCSDGDYITFLDSDDWLSPDALEIMLDYVTKSGADIVLAKYCRCYGDKSKEPKDIFSDFTVIEKKDYKKIYKRLLVSIKFNHVIHTLYSARLLKGEYFPEDLKTAEDLWYNANALTNSRRFVYTSRVLYYYYQRPDSLTGAGMSFLSKFNCNRAAAKYLRTLLPIWQMDNLYYRLLARLRPFTMIAQKLMRIIIR